MQVFLITSGTSGSVQFASLLSGYYIFRVEARNRERAAERVVIRRLLEVVGKLKYVCCLALMLVTALG